MDSQIDANKERYESKAALKLLQGIEKIISMKGKKSLTLSLIKDPPDEATLLAALLGPTGNLRAPTARIGKTLLVGFSPEIYQSFFKTK